jgi:peroxiredoxin Q/BCP
LAQLCQDIDQFVDREVAVVVIGPEDAKQYSAYFSKHRLPFIGLPDPRHQVIKTYGQEVKLFKFGRMPAQLLIDKQSTVRFVHYGHSMSDIPSNDELLSQVDEIGQEVAALSSR